MKKAAVWIFDGQIWGLGFTLTEAKTNAYEEVKNNASLDFPAKPFDEEDVIVHGHGVTLNIEGSENDCNAFLKFLDSF